MAISAVAALRRICEKKQWSITNLEANKLLYFAQMISLGNSKGVDPLVEGTFQAWDYGPVLPAAYFKARVFGDRPIQPFIFSTRGPISKWEPVFDKTLDEFGHLTSSQLVAESHWEHGAWFAHYRPGGKGIEIPNGDILKEYRARAD